MSDEQMRMPMGQRRAHRNHDYVDLFPGKVFPSGEFDILECGNALLVIKSYEYGKPIAEAHRRIFKLMVSMGDHPDAPGSITIYCVWNLGNTPREVVVFDHMGESERKVMPLEDWRAMLRGWWNDNKRRRR
jgi:hypothetical protein